MSKVDKESFQDRNFYLDTSDRHDTISPVEVYNNQSAKSEDTNSRHGNEVEVLDKKNSAVQNTNSATCKKCNFDILVLLEGTKQNPSQDDISSFICTFSEEECAGNVEFEEFYIELLFDLLAQSPQKLLNSLSETNPKQKSLIVEMIKTPVNDMHDISELISSVNSISSKADIKIMVLNALEVAKLKT